MNKPHKHCELIKAWADGAEIQRRKYASNEWVDTDPDWRVGTEYRIKPRTVKREGWVNIGKFTVGYFAVPDGEVFGSKEDALLHNKTIIPLVTVKVEWEEEVE